MARKGKSSEEIIAVLREAEVRIAQGETVGSRDGVAEMLVKGSPTQIKFKL